MKTLLEIIRDLVIQFLPVRLIKLRKATGAFAFIAHPRNVEDVYKKFPALKKFSTALTLRFLEIFWPVVVSEVSGLISQAGNKPIRGWIITLPLTAHQMMEKRRKSIRLLKRAVRLAAWHGVTTVGLGALTASVSFRGKVLRKDFEKFGIKFTSGVAFTAFNISDVALSLVGEMNISVENTAFAVVGAAGSIGSATTSYLASKGVNTFILIDLDRKGSRLKNQAAKLQAEYPKKTFLISHKIGDICKAEFVITATNAPEALIRSEDVKSGTIIVDDAQPSDVHPEIVNFRDDVIVVEGGVVEAKGIDPHISFGLKHRSDIFSCLAETLVRAAYAHEKWEENGLNLKTISRIANYAEKLGFERSEFQNFSQIYTPESIRRFRDNFYK